MGVSDRLGKIRFIPTLIFPKTALPNRLLCFLRYRKAETPASMSTGDWALASRDSDRFAGILFWRGRSRSFKSLLKLVGGRSPLYKLRLRGDRFLSISRFCRLSLDRKLHNLVTVSSLLFPQIFKD